MLDKARIQGKAVSTMTLVIYWAGGDGECSGCGKLGNAEQPRPTCAFFSFCFYYFLIEVYLIYNVVLVSGVQHSDLVIHTYIKYIYVHIYIYSFSDSSPLYVIVKYRV